MFSILRRRNYSLLWFGQLISTIGDWVLFIALPFYIFDLTGSTLATGLMFIAETLPRLFLGSIAGVFVDRWDRKRIMIVSDILRALVLLVIVFARSPEWVWLIYLAAFLQSTIGQFFGPAKSAIIPQLVSSEELLSANSLNGLSDGLTRLGGAALGGALMAAFGVTIVVLIDSASFLLSALMIALITVPAITQHPSNEDAPRAALARVWHELVEGLRLVKDERLVAAVFTVFGITMVAEGILDVLLVAFVKQVLGVGALEFGWIITAQGIGGIAGGIIFAQLGKSLQPTRLIMLGAWATGLIFLAIVNFPMLLLAIVLVSLIGVAIMAWIISIETLLQSNVADRYRGRVFGAFGAVGALAMLVGMGLASGLGDKLGVVPMLDVSGVFYISAGFVALFLMRGTVAAQPALQSKEPLQLS